MLNPSIFKAPPPRRCSRCPRWQVLNCSGSGTMSGLAAGINYVTANCPATRKCVINMSLGGGASTTVDNAVKAATNKGIVVAVAAGNDNRNGAWGWAAAAAAGAVPWAAAMLLAVAFKSTSRMKAPSSPAAAPAQPTTSQTRFEAGALCPPASCYGPCSPLGHKAACACSSPRPQRATIPPRGPHLPSPSAPQPAPTPVPATGQHSARKEAEALQRLLGAAHASYLQTCRPRPA